MESERQKCKQVEESLRIGEAFFRGLFDNMVSGCAIFEVMEDGSKGCNYIVKSFNKAALKIEGKTAAEVVGKSLSDLRPKIDEYGLVAVLKKVWESGIPDVFPLKMYRGDQFSNYYENYIFKIPSGEVVTTYNDLTEQKKQEEALRQSEARYRTLVNTIPDLVWLKDLEGVFLGCNPTFERFFGAKETEIVGKTDYDFTSKEIADFFREHDRKAMEAGGPSVNEERLTFADNGYQGIFETIKTPMSDADGQVIGVLGISRDITERKNAEDALKENEKRYKKAQRLGQVGNWEYDIFTKKFWGSDEAKRIYGFDLESDMVSVEEVESRIPERIRVHQALKDLIEKGKPYQIECEIMPCGKSRNKIVKSIAELVNDDSGAPRKVTGVIQDITRQKIAEKEKILLEGYLKQSQKMESIGKLAGGIAHDFNNILSSIIGFTELMMEEVEKGSVKDEYLQEVYAAGNRAKDLVKQFLTFARQSDEEIRCIQPDMIAEEVLKLMRSSIPTNIEIKHSIDSSSSIMGNATQFYRSLMNLCTNAAHAMEDTGGTLEVSLKDMEYPAADDLKPMELQPGKYIELKVSDTGMGIAPEIIDSIFDPYFTTKRFGEGTGMGLAEVHGIVENYGGKITVDSILGKGTVFTVFLPVAEKRHVDNFCLPEYLPTGSERILFVDDEVPITTIGRQTLRNLGYLVETSNSSSEALERFRSKPKDFDLVMTDMTMPEMTGDKLAGELMKIRSDIPVILCTGYSKKISEQAAHRMGIKALVYKPLVKADFAQVIKQVLGDVARK